MEITNNMSTIKILNDQFFNTSATKSGFLATTSNILLNISPDVSYYSTFYNSSSSYNIAFATCNETASIRDNMNMLLIYFPRITVELHTIENRTLFLFPRLVELFDEFAKYANAKNKPDIEVVRFSENHKPFILFDFSKCLEWIESRTQRLMLLKLIRALTTSIVEKKEPTWFRNKQNQIDIETIISMISAHKKSYLFVLFKNYFLITNKVMQHETSFLSRFDNVYDIVSKEIKKQQEMKKKKIPLKVWSRHPSHAPLRKLLVSDNTIIRFGYRLNEGTTQDQEAKFSNNHIIINPKVGIENSASKFKMKECFAKANVKTADWIIPKSQSDIEQFAPKYGENTKFIIKSEFGSRGDGLVLCENFKELIQWFNTPFTKLKKQKYGNYLVEKYYPYSREYRLHVTAEGCFYTCRKMLREDAEDRWYRNDSNSVWIVEENEMFQKPVNWNIIVSECVKALNSVGLDVGACDVRVQSARDNKERLRENPDFIICEINSAPGLGEVGLRKYQDQIHKIINQKLNKV